MNENERAEDAGDIEPAGASAIPSAVEPESQPPPIPFKEFLELTTPGQLVTTIGAYGFTPIYKAAGRPFSREWGLAPPELDLSCWSERCGGPRVFWGVEAANSERDNWRLAFLRYTCRNCSQTHKEYGLRLEVRPVHDERPVQTVKLGEWPPLDLRVPPRIFKLVGEDRDLFLKGRRAESEAMGIAAFTYYRRVLERQKARLVDQILQVARRTQASPEVLSRLERARDSWEFTRSVEEIKDAIPDGLKVQGHNPLVLLHGALSHGIHEGSDDDCLRLATSIRVVLSELAERLGIALQDQAELNKAVNELLRVDRDKKDKRKVNPADSTSDTAVT